jgi:hypothetical protein
MPGKSVCGVGVEWSHVAHSLCFDGFGIVIEAASDRLGLFICISRGGDVIGDAAYIRWRYSSSVDREPG